jgi:hypothetical protein
MGALASHIKTLCLAYGSVAFGAFIWLFATIGIVETIGRLRCHRDWRTAALPVVYLTSLLVFYVGIATFTGLWGGFYRSAMALVPFIVVMSVDAIYRHIPAKPVSALVLLFLGGVMCLGGIDRTLDTIEFNSRLGNELASLKTVLDQQSQDLTKTMVIMTRDPWELSYATGHQAIMIPNEGIDTIHEVAQKYGAEYLILPAPRSALAEISNGTSSDPRFVLIAEVPNTSWRLFRIE